MLEMLLNGFCSAGENFSGNVALRDDGTVVRVAMQLKLALPAKGKSAVTGYIRDFAKTKGWVVRDFKHFKSRVEFSCEYAERYPAAPGTSDRAPAGPKTPGQTPGP